MGPRRLARTALAVALLLPVALPALAADSPSASELFRPRVPVSAFGLARDWIDPSRLHVTSTLSMGTSGWGSRSLNALQVTTLSYSFEAPVSMSLSLGNAWGPNSARGGQSFFLEGFSLRYEPNPMFQFQVQYRDLRSPLQLSPSGFGSLDRWGYRGR
jgi:hypothetical protein